MSDASEFKVLKAGLNEHIETVKNLDADSVSEVNGRLGDFFTNVDDRSVPADHDQLDDLGELFEELNVTAFRKAREHNLVYSPYLLRFVKDPANGVKLKVLGAESAAFRTAEGGKKKVRKK